MSQPRLVEGQFVGDEAHVDTNVDTSMEARLRVRIRELESDIADFEGVESERDAAMRELGDIRRMAAALLHALLGAQVTGVDSPSPSASVAQGDAMWRERIAKLGGQAGRILEVLLEGGGPMSLNQIRSATKGGGATSARLSELVARNWVRKVGHGSYELKR